jgi:hypothetical protein
MRIITGWSPSGWLQYGQRFLSSFERYWPNDVELNVYVEELSPIGNTRHSVRQVLLDQIQGCVEFIEKYRNDKRANGEEVQASWKDSCRASGYNFRFDAWKFCRQGFIPYHAAQDMQSGILCWLDGDVVTTSAVPTGWIESLIPEYAAVSYLGREPKHSEIGVQIYRLPRAMSILRDFSDLYRTEAVFELKEWHSAYVFDQARRMNKDIPVHNMTPGGNGNVWLQSPMIRHTDHLKGKRKGKAR